MKLVVLILCLGAVALAATHYQRTAFDGTTSQLEDEMSAMVTLERALLDVDVPAAGMMYGLGGPEALDGHRAAYDAVRDRINEAFDDTEGALSSPAETVILSRARDSWQAMDVAVLAAPELLASGAVGEALASGQDPFTETVWQPLSATEVLLSELRAQIVVELRERTSAVNRIQRLIAPLVLGSLAGALILAWLAARRMSRQVVTPILELRQAALAMRDSNLDQAIEVKGATAELQDLAATINQTAVSLRASHGRLRDQAYTDALTGLPNRKAFTERLQANLAEPGGRVGVLFVDLDDFKVVNDTLGHAAGDELLRVVAGRLSSATRDGEMVARLGGDEFAIALDCGDQPASVITVAERTVAALQERVAIAGTNVAVCCSVGVAISATEPDIDAADELLRNADFAMYMAKSQGKNCFEVFAPSMYAEMMARTELKRELAQAVRLEQFALYYQPVVDLHAGDLLGFEALIRWQHPTRGLLPPGEFIGLAEDTGDIVEIGAWVVDQACRTIAVHHRQIPERPPLWMSVNVSASQITGPAFVDMVRGALDRHGVPGASLVLEITEAAAMTNTDVATAALAELRRHGVRVALDDFGIGFSSLRYLHELPVDVLKIDRSFVMNAKQDTDATLEAIVTLSRRLGLEIIAEGIEQTSELDRLRRFGPLAGQGYLFARPMPASDAIQFRCANDDGPHTDGRTPSDGERRDTADTAHAAHSVDPAPAA